MTECSTNWQSIFKVRRLVGFKKELDIYTEDTVTLNANLEKNMVLGLNKKQQAS